MFYDRTTSSRIDKCEELKGLAVRDFGQNDRVNLTDDILYVSSFLGFVG